MNETVKTLKDLQGEAQGQAFKSPEVDLKHQLFHRLWTKAVGIPGYDKAEWKELETRLK